MQNSIHFYKRFLNEIKSVAFFCLPFFLFAIIDAWIVKRPYYLGATDSLESYVGLGIASYFDNATPLFHHPGFFHRALIELFFAYFGVQTSIDPFVIAAFVLNLLFVVATGFWCQQVFKHFNWPQNKLIWIGLTLTAMPTLGAFFRNFSPHFLSSLLFTPIFLTFLGPTLSSRNRRLDDTQVANNYLNESRDSVLLIAALFFLGFSLGNYFPTLLILAGLGLEWVANRTPHFRRWTIFSQTLLRIPGYRFFSLTVFAVFFYLTLRVSPADLVLEQSLPHFAQIPPALFWGIFLSVAFSLVCTCLGPVKNVLAPLPLFVVGFLGGTAFKPDFWFAAFIHYWPTRFTTLDPGQKLFSNFYPFSFFQNYAWGLLVLFSLALLIKEAWASLLSTRPKHAGVLAVFFVQLASSAHLALIRMAHKITANAYQFALVPRYLSAWTLLPLVAVIRLKSKWGLWTIGTLCLLSWAQFVGAYWGISKEMNAIEKQLSEILQNPKATLLCAATSYTPACGFIYALHKERYRSGYSIERYRQALNQQGRGTHPSSHLWQLNRWAMGNGKKPLILCLASKKSATLCHVESLPDLNDLNTKLFPILTRGFIGEPTWVAFESHDTQKIQVDSWGSASASSFSKDPGFYLGLVQQKKDNL